MFFVPSQGPHSHPDSSMYSMFKSKSIEKQTTLVSKQKYELENYECLRMAQRIGLKGYGIVWKKNVRLDVANYH